MVATVVLLLAQFVPGAPLIPWGGTDFLQYYAANQLSLEGKNPYDRELNAAKQESFGRIVRIETYTPPWGFLPALPLSWLPFETAICLNIALNCLLLVLCVICWTRLLFPEDSRLIAFTLISLPLWMPCLSVIGIGQISLWPLLGFTGWLWFTTREKYAWGGACLALLIIKPHLGLLLGLFAGAYTLHQRQWKTLLGFSAAFALATLFTLLFRTSIWSDYLQSIQTSPSLATIHPATLEGWIKDNLGESLPAVTWSVWGLALLSAAIIGWRCGTYPRLVGWSAIMCVAAVAVVPYAFSFDFVLMLPGFLLALGTAVEKKNFRGRVAFLVWLAMDFWLIYGKLVPWSESAYFIIPWVGLAVTIWLARD